MAYTFKPDRLPPRPRHTAITGRALSENDYMMDGAPETERRPISELLHIGYFLSKLDVKDIHPEFDSLGGMYRIGASGVATGIRIFIEEPRGEVRRGHRVNGRVTKLTNKAAVASADEILEDYLQYTVGNKVDVVPTADNPYAEEGFVSHPDFGGGCKGILVLVGEDAPSEADLFPVRITGYRELEDSDFYLLNLDPDADKYLFTGRLWVPTERRHRSW